MTGPTALGKPLVFSVPLGATMTQPLPTTQEKSSRKPRPADPPPGLLKAAVVP